jgi:hypothetical protein
MAERSKQSIVKQIDDMEAELYGLYQRLMRLRLDLQAQWRVLPSGNRWTPTGQAASEPAPAAEDGRT